MSAGSRMLNMAAIPQTGLFKVFDELHCLLDAAQL